MKSIIKKDVDHLTECLSLIEQKLNWGPIDGWNNQDFISLGEKIFDKTGVKLSHTTLKRVWGKIKYDSFPQTSTLNALAAFLGYENWLRFKVRNGGASSNGNSENGNAEGPLKQTYPEDSPEEKRKKKTRIWQAVFAVSIIAFIVISVLNYPRNPGLTERAVKNIKFSSQAVASGIPNTVVFNYDVSKIRATLFEIQQYWDERKRFEISPLEKVATSLYYYPGYFRAKLLVDKQIVKEHDLFIKSGGWLAALESENTPRYLLADEIVNKPHLGVSETVLKEISESKEKPLWLGFHYVEELGAIDCDNFTFETAVKNTYSKGDGICRESRIFLLGTEGAFGIPLAIPGCVGDLQLFFNDVVHEGKTHDLSVFGTDYPDFQQLKLEVKNRFVSIFLNDKKIYDLEYNQSAGKLVGFRFKFKGAGEVNYVRVKDNTGKPVFEEDFGK